MKSIRVAAAIIEKDKKVLACQRGYGEQKGLWEFPGGKLEKGEDGKAALERELKEELKLSVVVDSLYKCLDYDYPEFHITIHFYNCTMKEETFSLTEHLAARWLNRDELDSVSWLGADSLIIPELKKYLE
ncbi:MAG: (deoxy)nucleoside triphosphate pyrophosphohydrolase [Sphaerochaetaceae bacterium]|nr:(deoxy)nucleoside triphosphate pyrophosphohydrolase [Sphaerochaetaceae bacterium]